MKASSASSSETQPRITSYNVCYTKLLRVGIDAQIVIEVLYRSMDKFALIVVLFFVLCGNIMTTGSIVKKLSYNFV